MEKLGKIVRAIEAKTIMDEQELFREYFREPLDDEEGEWMSPTEILRKVKSQRDNLDMSVERFGKYLSNMSSLPRRRGKHSTLYKVVLAA